MIRSAEQYFMRVVSFYCRVKFVHSPFNFMKNYSQIYASNSRRKCNVPHLFVVRLNLIDLSTNFFFKAVFLETSPDGFYILRKSCVRICLGGLCFTLDIG